MDSAGRLPTVSWQRVLRSLLLLLNALAVAMGPASGRASADDEWVQSAFRDLKNPFGIELSLSGNPFESNIRIPLTGRGVPSGSLTPYISAGATDPSRAPDAATALSARGLEASRTSQRMDIGAGLNWNLTDRVQLFGELGFQRSREQSYSLFGIEGNRDGTYVKGGLTIRVP